MQNRELNMLSGPFAGKILRYTFPLIVSGLLQLAFNTADTVVIGRFAGGDALAAVGSTGPLINLFVNMFLGLGVGVSVGVAHGLGAGRDDDVSRTVHTGVLTAMIGGAALLLVCFFGSPWFLSWMKTPENVIGGAIRYMRIYSLGMPATLVFNFCAAALRASGDTRRPTLYLIIAGSVNVLLNLLTVIVFGLGVAGVALATVVSQLLSAVLIVGYMTRLGGPCRIAVQDLRIDRTKLREILRIGLPAGLQSVAFSSSNVIIQSSVNSFGSLAVEGNTIGHNLDSILSIVSSSFEHAAMAFIGQNVGARRYTDLRRIAAACIVISASVSLGIGVGMYIFRAPLVSIFRPGEEEVLAAASVRMLMVTATYFIGTVMQTLTGTLRGMGEAFAPMIGSLVGVCALRLVWIYTVFAAFRTLDVLYFCYPMTWCVTIAIQLVLFAVVRRRLMRAGEQPQ